MLDTFEACTDYTTRWVTFPRRLSGTWSASSLKSTCVDASPRRDRTPVPPPHLHTPSAGGLARRRRPICGRGAQPDTGIQWVRSPGGRIRGRRPGAGVRSGDSARPGWALPGASLIGNYCELLASWACLVVLIRRTASRLQPNLAAGGLVLPKRAPAPGTRVPSDCPSVWAR